jgi:uncharacterized damage-inducible protein DinB
MKEYFLKLYQYNAWANKRVLGALEQQEVSDEKILSLMSHVLSAQFIWLHRITDKPTEALPLWERYDLSTLVSMESEIGQKWLAFVTESENFDRKLTYKNYVGNPYVNNVEQIMIHLVNHSTYHRAQIALLMRQKGYEPINTDFITYDRVITGQLRD